MRDRRVIHSSSLINPQKPREASRPKVARSTTKNHFVQAQNKRWPSCEAQLGYAKNPRRPVHRRRGDSHTRLSTAVSGNKLNCNERELGRELSLARLGKPSLALASAPCEVPGPCRALAAAR